MGMNVELFRRGRGGLDHQHHALVDVMLVLLIIFLITVRW
jgi:biopolymer transport protein ExbD